MSSVPTHQGVGISWPCASSDHGGCQQPGCRCMCHYRPGAKDTLEREVVSTPVEKLPTPSGLQDRNTQAPAPAQPTTAGQVCQCGKLSSATAKFCRHCGNPFVVAVFCENCGAKATTADSFCENCGAPIGSSEVKVKSPRKRKANGQQQ